MMLGRLPLHRICPIVITLVASTGSTGLDAQVRGSERATFTQIIAGTEIVIDYARPSLRGRDSIFGSQVHWEEVWTPGANDATTLAVSKDVTLNGHTVAAGKYSVWMQVLEGGEWTFMLHEDTTLFHVPHPTLDEGLLTFPITVTQTAENYETLTFDIQHVRATGGALVMRWGTTAATVALGVDPGFALTLTAAEAAPYVGAWMRTHERPADSVIAEWTDGMSEERLVGFNEWLTEWLSPTVVDVIYDSTSSSLLLQTRDESAAAEDDGEVPEGDDPTAVTWTQVLMPKSAGFFVTGWLSDGELWAASDGVWEFEFDEHGVAQRFLMLSASDEIEGQGERTR
jgi:hypothetical protein